MLKKSVQRFVRRESLNVKGFGKIALGNPPFHILPFTFRTSCERCENAAWEKARFDAPGLGG
jgi:hypothetical protein